MSIRVFALDPELPLIVRDNVVALHARIDATVSSEVGAHIVPTGVRIIAPPRHVVLIMPAREQALLGASIVSGLMKGGEIDEVTVLLYGLKPMPRLVRRGEIIGEAVVVAQAEFSP